MLEPHVKNEIVDKERGITFEVWAYRKLTYEEMVVVARDTMRDMGAKKRKGLKRGQRIIVRTIFGHDRPEP
jgi:hypothetical protein